MEVFKEEDLFQRVIKLYELFCYRLRTIDRKINRNNYSNYLQKIENTN